MKPVRTLDIKLAMVGALVVAAGASTASCGGSSGSCSSGGCGCEVAVQLLGTVRPPSREKPLPDAGGDVAFVDAVASDVGPPFDAAFVTDASATLSPSECRALCSPLGNVSGCRWFTDDVGRSAVGCYGTPLCF